MTLSLDEVRNIRFPMARKPNEDGYRASAVDNFMDKLEISYAQLVEEIDNLRAAKSDSDTSALQSQVSSLTADLDSARSQLEQLKSERSSLSSSHQQSERETQRLNAEISRLRSQLDEIRASSDVAATGSEQLRNENAQLHSEIEQLRTQLEQARSAQGGSAEGTVVDGVQHIEVTTSAQASPVVIRLVELATQQAETLISDAESQAQRRIDEANGQAERTESEAQARAAKLDQDTRADIERMMAEARARAGRLDHEVRDRRAELFSRLEKDRDSLADLVNQLRDYEENYRRTFAGFLQSQIEQLNNADLTNGPKPNVDSMYGLGSPQVSTPRLDALVAETRNEVN